MIRYMLLLSLSLAIVACTSTPLPPETESSTTSAPPEAAAPSAPVASVAPAGPVAAAQSGDPEYGYSPEKPINVGGGSLLEGPARQRAFLNSIAGPGGQAVTYRRLGSCCAFESPDSPLGGGLLDQYEVSHGGLANPVILYLNLYTPGTPLAPFGFTIRQ